MNELERGRIKPEDFKVPKGSEKDYFLEVEATIFHRTNGVKQSTPFVIGLDPRAFKKFYDNIGGTSYDHYCVLYDPTGEVTKSVKTEDVVADTTSEMMDALKAGKPEKPVIKRTPRRKGTK